MPSPELAAAAFSGLIAAGGVAAVRPVRRHVTPNRVCAISFAAAIPVLAVPAVAVALTSGALLAAPLFAVLVLVAAAAACFAPTRGHHFNRFERDFWDYVEGDQRNQMRT